MLPIESGSKDKKIQDNSVRLKAIPDIKAKDSSNSPVEKIK